MERKYPDWLIYGEGDIDAHMGKAAEDSDITKELSNAIDSLTTEGQILLLQIIQLIRKSK